MVWRRSRIPEMGRVEGEVWSEIVPRRRSYPRSIPEGISVFSVPSGFFAFRWIERRRWTSIKDIAAAYDGWPDCRTECVALYARGLADYHGGCCRGNAFRPCGGNSSCGRTGIWKHWCKVLIRIYVWFFRGVPLLVLIFCFISDCVPCCRSTFPRFPSP